MNRPELALLASLFFTACSTGEQAPGIEFFECWYRSTEHYIGISWGCPGYGCEPTGNGDEIICSCEYHSNSCKCPIEPNPENPADGAQNPFACFWVNDGICYVGPDDMSYVNRHCFCYMGFFCWRECEGRLAEDGRKVCMVDGEEVECQDQPRVSEDGRAVLCRYGAAPIPWPLPDE